VKFDPVA